MLPCSWSGPLHCGSFLAGGAVYLKQGKGPVLGVRVQCCPWQHLQKGCAARSDAWGCPYLSPSTGNASSLGSLEVEARTSTVSKVTRMRHKTAPVSRQCGPGSSLRSVSHENVAAASWQRRCAAAAANHRQLAQQSNAQGLSARKLMQSWWAMLCTLWHQPAKSLQAVANINIGLPPAEHKHVLM